MRKKGRVSAFALILILALICAILLITAAAVDNQRTYNREKAVTPTTPNFMNCAMSFLRFMGRQQAFLAMPDDGLGRLSRCPILLPNGVLAGNSSGPWSQNAPLEVLSASVQARGQRASWREVPCIGCVSL